MGKGAQKKVQPASAETGPRWVYSKTRWAKGHRRRSNPQARKPDLDGYTPKLDGQRGTEEGPTRKRGNRTSMGILQNSMGKGAQKKVQHASAETGPRWVYSKTRWAKGHRRRSNTQARKPDLDGYTPKLDGQRGTEEGPTRKRGNRTSMGILQNS